MRSIRFRNQGLDSFPNGFCPASVTGRTHMEEVRGPQHAVFVPAATVIAALVDNSGPMSRRDSPMCLIESMRSSRDYLAQRGVQTRYGSEISDPALDHHGSGFCKAPDEIVQIVLKLASAYSHDGVICADSHKNDVGSEVNGLFHLIVD